MRWSATLIPTLRETPAEAVAPSHRLMLRAGLIRQVGSGLYAYLPLGTRVLKKVVAVVREEMDRAGGIEVLMPALWPIELLQQSGRLDAFGRDLITFRDRHGRPHALAPTHEELVTRLAHDALASYKQLPLTLYQIQTKFRDEVRPRFGVLRTREFIMKDAYSFSADEAGLAECYEAMREAYGRIFGRCGLDCIVAQADPGAMGGEGSEEFVVPSPFGESSYVRCEGCGHTANVEAAAAPPPEPEPVGQPPELREVATPGMTSIEAVSGFLGVEPEAMIKTIIYVADGRPVAALVRGDHDVNEAKLRRVLGAESLEMAGADVVEKVSGAPVGFAGPVGLEGVETVADHAAAAVAASVTGANKEDTHLLGVVPGRDFEPDRVADIRYVTPEDRCAACGGDTRLFEGIELGHLFRLGTKYSEALGATYLDGDGREKPYVMGCYGIGVNRIVAALIEGGADERGIVWPPGVAPYEVLVLPLDLSEERIASAAEAAYEQLRKAGLDALLDDRDERPGVKFHDADLIGFPLRIVIGKGYLRDGSLELQVRRDDARTEVAPGEIAGVARRKLAELSVHNEQGS